MAAKCIDDNKAPNAQNHVNGQLATLWENAKKCASSRGQGSKPSDDQKFPLALAEYRYFADGNASKADMIFSASFGEPHIEFICNHDAVICLNIEKGHYNIDYEKAIGSHESAVHERNRTFNDVLASFRVPFRITGLPDENSKTGEGSHVAKLFTFYFQEAQKISIKSRSSDNQQALSRDDQQALSFYLPHYLRFLSNAGHHKLMSLPGCDDDNLSTSIDFSRTSNTVIPIEEIRGVSIEKINAFLSTAWSKATNATSGDVLAEYGSTFQVHGSNFRFSAKMGAPRVQAICDQEVILYCTIDHLDVYDSAKLNDNFHSYQNWEIAVLVNVVTSNDEDGKVTRCRLDFETWRYVQQRSKFPGLDEGNAVIVDVRSGVVDSFSSAEYFKALKTAEYDVIYHDDRRLPKPSPVPGADRENHGDGESERNIEKETLDASWEPGQVSDDEWRKISETVDMGGFDQIMAISQGGIIAHFLTLWNNARTSKEASLVKWSYEDFFEATFKPMTLRLLSNGRAIVWIHLKEGSLTALRGQNPPSDDSKYSFKDWSLAFEVDIKICNHSELKDMKSEWRTQFENSHAYKEHGQQSDRVLKHIYLDFRSAEFVHKLPSSEDLSRNSDESSIDKDIVAYVKTHYFQQITSFGYHILITIPVWNAGSTPPSYGLTFINFHVYCKQNVTRDTEDNLARADEPVIILLGMTGFRPLPSRTLQFSANWIAQPTSGVSYGTTSLPKHAFIEERLLTPLARLNALTTIVPLFTGTDKDAWRLKLTTWAKREIGEDRACSWVPVNEERGILKYKWEHQDEWIYSPDGSSPIANGNYTILCVTNNYLHIPTTFNRGVLEIKLEGNASVSMTYKDVLGSWNTESSAKWHTTLAIKPDAGGLRAEVIDSAEPIITRKETPRSSPDPETLLTDEFPRTVDLSEVVGELKNLEGAWHTLYMGLSAFELTQPVFNAKGDLLFKLRPFGVVPSAVAKPAPLQVARSSAFGNGSATSPIPQRNVKSPPSTPFSPLPTPFQHIRHNSRS